MTIVQQVAQSLSNGIIPEAERFQVVTILFSDVPSFSRIVGSVKPTTVWYCFRFSNVRYDTSLYLFFSVGGV